MTLPRCLALAIAAVLVAAPAAHAQSGNGLYEPFPEGIRKDRAVLFVERLGLGEGPRLTIGELERGRFLASEDGETLPAHGGSAGASDRAGTADGGGLDLAELALVGAAALGAALLLARRRPRARVAPR